MLQTESALQSSETLVETEMLERARTIHPIPLTTMLSLTRLSSMVMRKTWSLQDTPDVSDNESEKGESDHEHTEEVLLIQVPRLHLSQLDDEMETKPQSIFYKYEKYVIVVLGGLSGFWSSISLPIYVPVLSQIEESFKVTELDVNITLVVYSIFQGLGPVVFSNLADSTGRRPIILVCLLLYVAANVLIAVNTSFPGLVVLRCIQAFGISSTISVGSGIASDITTRAERASFIGLTTGLALLGQAFGAFIGGMISSAFGWRAIFWFLAISAGVTFLVIYVLLPETGAKIVGMKADRLPTKWTLVTVAPIMKTRMFKNRLTNPKMVVASSKGLQSDKTPQTSRSFNLFKPLKILAIRQVYMTLIPASLCYALWLMMLTSLSHALTKDYGFSLDQVALAYIPSGLGGLAGSVSIGEMLDYSYKRSLRKSQTEGCRFSVLRSRLIVSALPSCLCVGASLVFAWTLQLHGPVALVIVASCIIAYGAMNWLTISSTVVVDANPTQASGSCACVNLTRCWCAALFVGVLTQMESMGMGWCYTLMAVLCGLASFCVAYLYIEDGKR